MSDPKIKYTLCHGSGNRFVMIDTVRNGFYDAERDLNILACNACRLDGGLDGLLLVSEHRAEYEMKMFNTDGSSAEMCGNGIRCVARLIAERYVAADHFTVWSAGRRYEVSREASLFETIPTFGVEIPVRRASDDFCPAEVAGVNGFVDRIITALDPKVAFTYLSLGNPHLVGCVDTIDMEQLEQLGHRVSELPDLFPHGINVSLFRREATGSIFVATCERGVGITASCGTAMTASSTAACLLGLCDFDTDIKVRNNGGMVICRCIHDGDDLRTKLVGNATYEAEGVVEISGSDISPCGDVMPCSEEKVLYDRFLQSLCRN